MNTAEFDRAFPTQSPTEDDRFFDQWMRAVDLMIAGMCGLSANDLPDFCYRDAFDDGASPKQTARRAIKAAKEDF